MDFTWVVAGVEFGAGLVALFNLFVIFHFWESAKVTNSKLKQGVKMMFYITDKQNSAKTQETQLHSGTPTWIHHCSEQWGS
jgi:hypothetical protein